MSKGAQQADGLSQAEPVSRLGPPGFDPSRLDWQLILDVFRAGIRRGTEEATSFDWGCHPTGKWEDELVEVIYERINEGWCWETRDGSPWDEAERVVRAAIATETRRAETENTGSVEDEGAGPKDIAQ